MAPAVCSVCNDDSKPPTSTCPTCRLPCHTRYSSKKMNAVCNNCRKIETLDALPPETSTPAVLTSATKLTQVSDKSARRKPSGKYQVSIRTGLVLRTKSAKPRVSPHHQTRLAASTPTKKEQRESSLHSSNTSAGRVTDIQALALLTSASADESSAQDTVNTRKTRAKDAPLGDTSLLGVSNILIPVSTMELFFQRFDMLQDQLDGLRALVSRGSVPRWHLLCPSRRRCYSRHGGSWKKIVFLRTSCNKRNNYSESFFVLARTMTRSRCQFQTAVRCWPLVLVLSSIVNPIR
ncbi:hypothetical protein TSAR_014158 [Trichomalopsis sarcophagae]|uniref:Uncharacterized protein n=1 Tax=Trichomalopsis sarcophagae TaxID=543379 RepID=A0A232EMV6_9HYME|nr:hypothetical protein TSAR_014158 [Trichomalopsis sarcophagae]